LFSILIWISRRLTSKQCTQLASTLGSSLISFPNTSVYATAEKSYWSLQESSLVPTCVVSTQSAGDVAAAVSVLVESDCQFAIKGGTHAPAAGFANIAGGITIDLSSLNTISLNTDHSVVSVGAGMHWVDVYAYLDQYNLSAAGGRNGAVGVGGLLLGGGISHFTTRVGWACDNVVNFEVVLANGSLVDINEGSSPLLFQALKGGGNNFGVVTRFDLATISQGNISVTTIAYNVTQRNAVFNAFTNLTTATPFDPYVSLVTGFLYNATSKAWSLSNSAVYTKPILNPPVFEQLKSIPNVSNKTSTTKLSLFANETATPPL
jgi:FAD/FMN-containing dehydrogenase